MQRKKGEKKWGKKGEKKRERERRRKGGQAVAMPRFDRRKALWRDNWRGRRGREKREEKKKGAGTACRKL